MNQNVTIDAMLHLALQRTFHRTIQNLLREARLARNAPAVMLFESALLHSLDRLWEAEQRAA
jgi:hypothetical protein